MVGAARPPAIGRAPSPASPSSLPGAFLATTASILIDDTDGAVFATRTEVPVF